MKVNKKHLKLVFVLVLLAIIIGLIIWQDRLNSPVSIVTPKTTTQNTKTTTQPSFNKNQYSLSDPASIWIVVNKQRPLAPKDYVPTTLTTPNIPLRVPGNESMKIRSVTTAVLEELVSGAKQAGLSLMLSSGYRSYSYQVGLYNGYVASQGQAVADTQSARPGYSEHQTGLAIDVEPASKHCEVEACFADTPEGQWLAANAYKYGFIIRYPKDKTNITGYTYEPWHIRFVGKDLSQEMHNQNIQTLEEFFGLPAAATY
jgi:D-alanyl-D-alanine carboxypeptidase